jgi:hypothetical protein
MFDGSTARASNRNSDLEWWVRQDKNQYRGKMVAFLNRKIILEERYVDIDTLVSIVGPSTSKTL